MAAAYYTGGASLAIQAKVAAAKNQAAPAGPGPLAESAVTGGAVAAKPGADTGRQPDEAEKTDYASLLFGGFGLVLLVLVIAVIMRK